MNSPGNELTFRALQAMLPDAWPVFFRGRRPFVAQAKVMPEIVRGNSVFLAAPTASGKTEAAIAPLFQRHISFRRSQLSTIYVAPTKALVNDLHARLVDYFAARTAEMVSRYTGDRHEFGSPDGGFCLLVTPEALDSLQLMRPDDLSSVRAIVVDEIHLLHGSARGQQLRHVIDRIRHHSVGCGHPNDVFQIVGMTATVDRMSDVAVAWLGDGCSIVSDGEPRAINFERLSCSLAGKGDWTTESARCFRGWIEEKGYAKVLLFCNRRNGTHAVAAQLDKEMAGTRWPVHMHMGPLTATERERVELEMRNSRYGICVATSTLELGIDIGDVDVVVLADPPLSVSAFLQRIGRGNRRSGMCQVTAFVNSSEVGEIYEALLDCARRGELDDMFEYDRPSVRFQQILSLLWKHVQKGRGLTRKQLADLSGGMETKDVLEDMLRTGAVKNVGGVLIPSDALMDEGDARRIHTVIAGAAGIPVIDTATGVAMAEISDAETAVGEMFVGGKRKRVSQSADGSLYLERSREKDQPLIHFPSARGGGSISRAIVAGMARQRGLDPTWWHWEGNLLVTWGGKVFNRLLAVLYERARLAGKLSCTDYGVAGAGQMSSITFEKTLNMVDAACLSRSLPQSVAKKFAHPTRFLDELSLEMQAQEFASSVPYEPFRRWVRSCQGIRDRAVQVSDRV